MPNLRNYSGFKGFSATYLGLLGALILFVVLMGIILILLGQQSERSETNLNLASEQRLLAGAIPNQALDAVRGRDQSFTILRKTRERFDQIIQEQSSSAALPAATSAELAASWNNARGRIEEVLVHEEAISTLNSAAALLESPLTQLIVLSDEIAKSLSNNRAEARQVYLATNQVLLGQRIDSDLRRMLTDSGVNANAAADRLKISVGLFGSTLQELRKSGISLPNSASKLTDIAGLFKSIEAETTRILEKASDLFSAQSAAQWLAGKSNNLLEITTKVQSAAQTASREVRVLGIPLSYPLAYLLGIVALFLLLALLYVQSRESQQQLVDAERRKQDTEDQNRRNQDAILRLLDELGNLAEGDLTVQASVTEDITGAIADSVNYAIEALRDLVSTINSTSGLVASAVQETSAIADRLAKSSEIQARQIENASSTVVQMSQSMDDVSTKTAASAEVAEKSVGIAHEGGDRVRRTINGMNAIREHIQDTSKRIKRLGESSQEIGDIVALINDIADQTNILALNAAIQASAAGEAGRGFAVVADEVQRLAERSSNATKRIETLVKTIQADTNEAVISMEKSTSEVVGGAGLAEKAGEALEEIEKVSAKLAELIDEISKSASQVSEMASRVSNAMIAINDITGQTAESSVSTASAIGKLHQLAQELRQSVAGFRLPD